MIDAMEGWVSPVDLIYEKFRNNVIEQTDEYIKARCESALGVKVDRDELIKAMNYDREQYKKGYQNGYEKRDKEIVRCKDCMHRRKLIDNWFYCEKNYADMSGFHKRVDDDFFCGDGERSERNDS